MYTNELLDSLLSCPKIVTEGLKSVSNRGGFIKKEFKMRSQDGLYDFKGFLNQNEHFPEDYSLGLVYDPKEEKGKIVIIRVNGLHGGNKHIPHHNYCHEHKTDAEDINNGFKVERHVKEITDYTTFEQAIQYYVKRINIIEPDKSKHFPLPHIPVPTLFDGLL